MLSFPALELANEVNVESTASNSDNENESAFHAQNTINGRSQDRRRTAFDESFITDRC